MFHHKSENHAVSIICGCLYNYIQLILLKLLLLSLLVVSKNYSLILKRRVISAEKINYATAAS